MKKFILLIITLFAIFSLCLVGCDGCDGGENPTPTPPNVEVTETYPNMKLAFNEKTLDLYDDVTLTAKNCENPTFESSDSSVATVSASGLIVGLKVGTADITVKADDTVRVCKIEVVDNGLVPIIQTETPDEFSLYCGDVVSVLPKLTFNGKEVDGAFNFASDATSVATVSENGEVTAVAKGSATITIKGEYRGKAVVKAVTVNVVASNYTIDLASYEYDVYTSDVFGGQTQFTLNPIVKLDGLEVQGAAVTYSYDEEVLNFSGNQVSANVNNNEYTTITLEYRSGNELKASATVSVNVIFPVLDKTESSHYYVDNWKDSERGDKSLGKNDIVFPYADVFESYSISNIYDATTGELVDLKYAPATGVLGVDSIGEGKKIWQISNEEFAYLVKVTVVDRVIMNADELKAMIKIASDENIVLGADISGVTGLENSGVNFSGTFDGDGHTIDGLSFGATQGGLFSRLSGAKVSNIILKNVDVTRTSVLKDGEEKPTIFGHSVFGQIIQSSVENVYAEVISNSNEYEGGLFNHIAVGVTLKNIVVNYQNTTPATQVGALARSIESSFSAEEVYVVCDEKVKLVSVFVGGVTLPDTVNKFATEMELCAKRNMTLLSGFVKDILDEKSALYGDGYADDDFGYLPA